MTNTLPPRLHPYRDDLAAEYLKGKLTAVRYSKGYPAQVIVGQSSLRRHPVVESVQDSELLFGEKLTVYEEKDGWAWVQNARDSYVGYVRFSDLSREVRATTHRVTALRTYVYPQPDMKTPPLDLLSMQSAVLSLRQEGRFTQIQGGGWVFTDHISPQSETAADHVSVAKRFLGTPYCWGGKTSIGIDCSGLVQIALGACGHSVLRDTGMQEQTLGTPINSDQVTTGDLLYWPGHVAIALDSKTAIHATAHSMDVTIEPISHITERVEMDTGGTGMTAIKRIS
ncbi:NlpC/P60 family protein [Kiloniella laminariae]|uniref:NlpC/P60 family protein n=1 Tax=Kiloniella laminariae TaxID=454162 RepID=A0ABT4LHJ6_9PROT|nr:NlpC/P60 family protein [Kiloniella laminariae]MCZ4280578.1 NlpC/P60 family protein [Kiloniella laminariae]